MKYILMGLLVSLLRTFYVGVCILLLLILGLFNPDFSTVAGILFIGWISYAVYDQMILAKTMRDNPELQEIVNHSISNHSPSGQHVPEHEITFCELPEDEVKLAGRCLDPEGINWSMRFLYNGTYQIFSWKLVYNERFFPQIIVASGDNIPANSYWVKCYEKNDDGISRWNLHLLRRSGGMYQDIPLDIQTLSKTAYNNYTMKYDSEEEWITVQTEDSAPDNIQYQTIGFSCQNMGPEPTELCFGRMTIISLEKYTCHLSLGYLHSEFGSVDIAHFYVAATYYFDGEQICWSEMRIEKI